MHQRIRKFGVTLDDSTAGSLKIRVVVYKAGTNTPATGTDWAPGAGDATLVFEGSTTFTNLGALPTYVGKGIWEVTVSGTELGHKNPIVVLEDPAIDTVHISIETDGNASAMWPPDYADAAALGLSGVPADVKKYNGTTVGTYAADAQSAASLAGSANTNASNALSVATTLTSRLTLARAGYLDNLSGGTIATQADINALNQSASRRVILVTVGQYERPEAGTSSYTVEARTYDGDGAAVNADSTPTLTATGIVTGSLSANLSAATNPATGVYRWTYTVASNATLEQVRFDLSATIGGSAFPMTVYTQVADFVAATWTTADRTLLNTISTDVLSRLAASAYVAPDNASIGAALSAAEAAQAAAQAIDVQASLDAQGYTAARAALLANLSFVTAAATNAANLGSTNIAGVANSLASMISAQKFTAAALSNAPAGVGGSGTTVNEDETIVSEETLIS